MAGKRRDLKEERRIAKQTGRYDEWLEAQRLERNERVRRTRQAHLDTYREINRAYYWKHREEILAKKRGDAITNARQREYYWDHREEINARRREYYWDHREEINARRRVGAEA